MLVTLAVIGFVALHVVRWREPETGDPLPRSVAIVVPLLAGALYYCAGAAILGVLGLPVEVEEPRKESSPGPDNLEAPGRDLFEV